MADTIERMTFGCIQAVCKNLIAKKDLLNDLDAVMGDGEHGSNIERSFGMVQDALPQIEGLPAGEMIDKTGSLLLAAEKGAAETSNMIAKRGRGYYVGERGIGTCDPGAVSIATIFKTIGESLKEIK